MHQNTNVQQNMACVGSAKQNEKQNTGTPGNTKGYKKCGTAQRKLIENEKHQQNKGPAWAVKQNEKRKRCLKLSNSQHV